MSAYRNGREAVRGTGARRRGRGRACALPLWRTREPGRIGRGAVTDIARAVGSTAILHERRWGAAKDGDAAAAAAMAIDRLRRHGPVGPIVDLVMGNLVVLAKRDGDPTAPVIIAHALRALARREADGGRLADLAEAWAGPSRRERSRAGHGRRA